MTEVLTCDWRADCKSVWPAVILTMIVSDSQYSQVIDTAWFCCHDHISRVQCTCCWRHSETNTDYNTWRHKIQ